MEEKVNSREISLKVLWQIFVKRLWIMAVVAVVAVVSAFGILKATFKPLYKSVSDLYLLAETGTTDNPNMAGDFMLALNLVNDCKYIIYSDAVLDEVSDNLKNSEDKIEIKPVDLKNAISVTTSKEVRFLNVSVQWGNPEQSKTIVDELCKVSVKKANEVMQNETMQAKGLIRVYSEGKIPTDPCNAKGLGTYILVGFIFAVLTYIVFLVLYVVDDRIRTNEDVYNYFGLSVLGDIPSLEEIEKYKKGYHKYNKYYKKYYSYSNSEKNDEMKEDK